MPEAISTADTNVGTTNVDEICCAYCGWKDKQYLTYCGAENCLKWFCNGTFDRKDKSHIVAHCCKSKHTAVSIFRGIPEGTSKKKSMSIDWILKQRTYQPKCSECPCNNVFDLAVEDVNTPFTPTKTWCRKHAVGKDKVGKDLWNTLVAAHPGNDKSDLSFLRLAAWLVPVVSKTAMKKNFANFDAWWGPDASERDVIDILEEFWRWNPVGTMAEFLEWKIVIDNFCTYPKTEFDDSADYSSYWDSLIGELSRQEKGTVESLPPMRNMEVTWQNTYDIQVIVPQGIFTDFLEVGRPMEAAWVVLNNGAERDMWRRDATISFMKPTEVGHRIVVHCLAPVSDRRYRVSRDLQFRMVYNEVNYWRMDQALFKLEHDPMCISPEVLEIILGRRPVTEEELVQWTSKEFTPLNLAPSQPEENQPDAKEDSKDFRMVVQRTMNSKMKRTKLPPFHTEYVDVGTEFRNFPFSTILSPQLNGPLNAQQKKAVEMALRTPVCLIQGPPGTGKTKTAAAIVANFAQDPDGKILVCAPSNVAVDNLTLVIAQLSKDFNILRLFAHTRDVDCLDDKVREYTVFRKFKKERPGAVESDKALRAFERECIQKAQIICCTCNSAGLSSLEKVAFSYVLIDEAAQGMEPECLIPITRACEKLVLIGDPAQLGSVVRFPNLQRSQLTVSLFQRLWEKKNVCPWMTLTQQYRMHPKISKIVSAITYDEQLVDDSCVVDRPPVSNILENIFAYGSAVHRSQCSFPEEKADTGNIPMIFVDLARNDEVSASGTSYVNMMEAHFIARLVANILHEGDVFGPKNCPFGELSSTTNPNDIGIITFYNGQRPQLEIDLKKHHRITSARTKEIEINSVDGFQGREKDIIVLSCVRSAETCRGRRTMGFTDDPQRLNVAMSRARQALIVVGNSNVFQNSKMWCKYFKYMPKVPIDAVCRLLPIKCSTRPPCKICPQEVQPEAE